MNAGKAIYYLLSNASSVTDICGTRIYPELAEQEAPTPFVVYEVISVDPDDTNDGPAKLDEVSIDITAVADSYDTCADLTSAIRSAIDRVRGTYNGVNVDSIQYSTTDTDVFDSPRRYAMTAGFIIRISRDDAQIATGQPIDLLTILRLADTPSTYGTTGQLLVMNAAGDALEWASLGEISAPVSSVNGEVGAVVLDTDDIDEAGTNLYYTDARVDARVAALDLATEAYVDTQVGNEETARITADGGLQTQINAISSGVTGNAADIDQLETDLAAETAARIAADSALQTNIDTNATAITNEASARASADSNLQSQISSNDGDITALDGRLTTAESDIAALEAITHVNSINNITGAVTLTGGSNVTLTQAGNDITISSSGGGGGGGSDSFNTIAVSNQTSIVADHGNDTLTIVAGTGIELTTDAVNDALTIATDLTTTDVPEGANLYYTEVRVAANSAVAANTAKNSYPAADAAKLAGIEAGAEVNPTANEIKTLYESNADTNAFTDAEQTKLTGIEAGAEVNVNADWNATSGDAEILNKPTLSAVATSGAYADLSGTPTIPADLIDLGDTPATYGTSGQVLTSTGTGTSWTTLSGGGSGNPHPKHHALWNGRIAGTASTNTPVTWVNFPLWSDITPLIVVAWDSSQAINASLEYVVPETGLYEANSFFAYRGTGNADVKFINALAVNGSPFQYMARTTKSIITTNYDGVGGTGVVRLTAGDRVTFLPYVSVLSGPTPNIVYSAAYMHFAIRMIDA